MTPHARPQTPIRLAARWPPRCSPGPAFAQEEGSARSARARSSSMATIPARPPPRTRLWSAPAGRKRSASAFPRLRRRASRPEQSWASRVELLEEASRDTRPNSCSVVGTYGQSGCTAALIRQWYAERRARRSAAIRRQAAFGAPLIALTSASARSASARNSARP